MLSRGKIAWLGILLLALLVTFRGQNVLYRVWTTRNALAIEDRNDLRSAVEKELSALPGRRAALVEKKLETDTALRALRAEAEKAMQRSRELRRQGSVTEREKEKAERAARSAKNAVISTFRKTGDRSLSLAKLTAALRTGHTTALPAILSPLIATLQEAQARAGEEWEKQKALVRETREALKSERNVKAARDRLANTSRRLGREIAALDRRTMLLTRRLTILSKPRTVSRQVAPQTTPVTLKGSASLSGSVGDATTPLIYNDLSKDQASLNAFLSNGAKTQKKFDWPVSPATEGISAYFHDELYVARMGQDHFAIDIVADQGTEIVAPADGLVLKAEDSGTGFQYILLLHKNGYMSFYGHVSEFDVEAGDLVRRGAILGKSGGQPGTTGAGKNTTGPHLHFEVWRDNRRLNPLLYLDLAMLPKNPVKIDPDQVPSDKVADLDS